MTNETTTCPYCNKNIKVVKVDENVFKIQDKKEFVKPNRLSGKLETLKNELRKIKEEMNKTLEEVSKSGQQMKVDFGGTDDYKISTDCVL